MILDVNQLDLIKALTRTEAKAVHGELPPGGVWRTIRGHHVYISKEGKIVAGAVPGVTKAKKMTKAQMKEHQEHIDKEAKPKKGGKPNATGKSATKPKATPKASAAAAKGKEKTTPRKSAAKAGAKTAGAVKKQTKAQEAADGGKVTKPTGHTKGTHAPSKKPAAKTETTKKKVAAPKAKPNSSKPAVKPASKTKKPAKDIRSDAQKNRTLAYDVGDKVGGARKDTYEASFRANPNNMTLEDLEKSNPALAQKLVTKANILQPLDFEKEYKSGTDLETAVMKKLIYDRIAPKPAGDTPEDRKSYMQAINKITRHLEGVKTWDNMRNAIRELSDLARTSSHRHISSLQSTVAYQDRRANNKDYVQVSPEEQEKAKKLKKEYEGKLKDATKAKAMLDFEALGDKLNGFFTDYKSRERTLDTVHKNAKGGWDKYLNPEAKEKAPKAPKENENVKWERKAEAEHLRTGGKKITVSKPEELMKNYGMRGVEFGNWVNDASGKYHLQRCAESFHDLSDVIGIKPKDISLNGRLAIAFGARGKGGALAHYEPSRKVINMTKYGGAGSLAHEWGHAMDNILYQYSHGGKDSMNLASDGTHHMGDHDPKLKVLYNDLINAMKNPVPGEAGAVKKTAVDSEINKMASYYPAMRNLIRQKPNEEGMHEAIQWGLDHIRNKQARVNAYFKMHKEAQDEYAKKRYEKAMNKEVRDMNKFKKDLPHLIAYDMHRVTGQPFKGTISIPQGTSNYYHNMTEMDGNRKAYYAQNCEMFARVFESYVQHKLEKDKRYNNYLVHGTTEKHVQALGAPFPVGKERERMFKALENLLAHVSSKNVLEKAMILEVLANHDVQGDMTELIKAYTAQDAMDDTIKTTMNNHWHDSLLEATGQTKRNAYNIDPVAHPEVIYIPLNRLKTPYQTMKATDHDKVQENYEKMVMGQLLEPIVVGFDYDIQDGHHRYEASHLADYTHIPCVLQKAGSEVERKRALEHYQSTWL